MSRFILAMLLSFCLLSPALANPIQAQRRINHVIYITFDGVRWQDIFQSSATFKKVREKYGNNLVFYGMPEGTTSMEVASVPISLPSYQSQMAGSVQPCANNACGRINVETFPEKLINTFGWAKKEVVVFSSWWPIAFAAEHQMGSTFLNVGNMPVFDPDTNIADDVMTMLNLQQFLHQPGDADRYDRYTLAQALHYFKKYQPHFMWISLDDADIAAHWDKLGAYYAALKLYDDALDNLFTILKDNHLDQDTMVIVTTDHGRGNNEHWTDHGPEYPESKRTWAFTYNGELVAEDAQGNKFSTLSIRPTVEKAFGI